MILFFEGVDGVGKTTQLNLISSSKVINTDFIKIDMDKPKGATNTEKWVRETKSCKSLTNLIISANNSNQSMLIDRGYLSMLVYGTIYREYEEIDTINAVANEICKLNMNGIIPTFIIFSDCSSAVVERDDGASLFSQESNLKENISLVQDEYKRLISLLEDTSANFNIILIDNSNFKSASLEESIQRIHEYLIKVAV